MGPQEFGNKGKRILLGELNHETKIRRGQEMYKASSWREGLPDGIWQGILVFRGTGWLFTGTQKRGGLTEEVAVTNHTQSDGAGAHPNNWGLSRPWAVSFLIVNY